MITDSVAQAAGAAMFIVGLTAKETYLRRVGGTEINVTPIFSQDTAGLGLSVSF